jgi:membrane dipeptidase
MRLIIDAHLDLAWNALSFNRDQKEPAATINEREHGMTDCRARRGACVSLPELRRGGVAVCLATVLCRAKREVQPPAGHLRVNLDYGSQDIAYAIGQGQLAYYHLLERQGEMRQIRTVRDLDEHWLQWEKPDGAKRPPVGYILAMEGADPIVVPAQAEAWWNDGLRSLILAHYGQGHYSDGTGGTGGLTLKGRELLKEVSRLGIIVDLTHTTDRSFFEVVDLFAGPLMASHSNCRALVPNQRQFTDEQIKTLLDREAVIGVALDAWMLRPGWVIGQSKADGLRLAAVVDQIDHYCQLSGNADHVAIGSDLDGGFGADQRPEDVHSIADLQQLGPLLSERGYPEADIDKIFHANWLRFFRQHLPVA